MPEEVTDAALVDMLVERVGQSIANLGVTRETLVARVDALCTHADQQAHRIRVLSAALRDQL